MFSIPNTRLSPGLGLHLPAVGPRSTSCRSTRRIFQRRMCVSGMRLGLTGQRRNMEPPGTPWDPLGTPLGWESLTKKMRPYRLGSLIWIWHQTKYGKTIRTSPFHFMVHKLGVLGTFQTPKVVPVDHGGFKPPAHSCCTWKSKTLWVCLKIGVV